MRRLGIMLIAAAALAAGLYVSSSFNRPVPQQPKQMVTGSDLAGSYRPEFRLGSITGEFVTPEDFRGEVLLINFWATWCAPCREEMPMLVDLQNEYGPRGLQIIGIALDDVQSVRDFVQKYSISYPVLVGAADVMQTSHDYGNTAGVLPYSVLVDKDGVIRWQYTGEIQREEFLQILRGLL